MVTYGGDTILVDDFKNLSSDRKSAFSKLFVLPIYSNDLDRLIEENNTKEIAENKYSVSVKEIDQINLLGSDFLLNRIDKEYGVLYGVLRKAKSEDLKAVRKYLIKKDIEPIETSSSSLYHLLRDQRNYRGYTLREYRAGAKLLQSYFKDHTQLIQRRLILKRLERDWKDGLKPYFATLKSRNENVEIQVEGEGFITMDRMPETMDLVDLLVDMNIRGHRKALGNVRKVKMFRKEELRLQVNLHSNLVINLDKQYQAEHTARLEAASERLIGYLNEAAGVYGINKNKGLMAFNLVYSKSLSEGERVITSALSVDISPENIIISPNSVPNYSDLIHLYYGIDRYFEFAI